jgi:hypothetical protein
MPFTGVSLRPVRHAQHQVLQLSGTYLLDDFRCDAWRWTCLTGRRDTPVKGIKGSQEKEEKKRKETLFLL